MSCWDCCFKLSKNINVTEIIVKYMAFAPPKSKNYFLREIPSKGDNYKDCLKRYDFIYNNYSEGMYPWLSVKAFKIKKTSGNWIVVLYIKNKNKQLDTQTILLSHGNASNLGSMFAVLVDLSTQLKSDVVSYDYSGYGESDGSPSEKAIYEDIEEVAEFMTKTLQISQEKIILIGNSLGSAPSIHLAIHNKYQKISGILLLSPIGSGIKLVHPTAKLTKEEYDKYDCFCNVNKIKDVNCPIFIIHGMQDEIIPHTQSIEMAQKIRYLYQWFPRQGNHNNIMYIYRDKFYSKLKIFLEHVKHFYNNKGKKDVNIYNCTRFGIRLEENYIESGYDNSNGEEEKTSSKKDTDHSASLNLKGFSTNNAFNILYSETDNKNNPFIIQEKFFYFDTDQDTEKMSLVNVKNDEIEEQIKLYQKQYNGIL